MFANLPITPVHLTFREISIQNCLTRLYDELVADVENLLF
jgi:hypothetical protein